MRIWPLAALLVGTNLGAQQDSARVGTWAGIFARARAAQDAQEFRLAKTLYDSVIALDPRNSMAYMQRGLVHHNLADEAASRADLEKSVALGNPMAASFLSGPGNLADTPADTVGPQRRGEILNESGMAKLANGDTAAALQDLKRAYELGNAKAGDTYLLIESNMAAADSYRRNSKWYDRWLPRIPFGAALALVLAVALTLRVLVTPRGHVPMDELQPDEKLLWSGVPQRSLAPNPQDLVGLMKGVFFLVIVTFMFHTNVWELLFAPNIYVLLGAAIGAAGAWQVVAPYFNTLRDRKRSGYLLTDKRVLISRGSAYFIEHKIGDLANVTLKTNRDGTATLDATKAPAFIDHVAEGQRVKELIEEAHEAHVESARNRQR